MANNFYKRKKIGGYTFTTSPNTSTRVGRTVQKGSKNGLSTISTSTKNGKTRITETRTTSEGTRRTTRTINSGTKPRLNKANKSKPFKIKVGKGNITGSNDYRGTLLLSLWLFVLVVFVFFMVFT